jgi:hypothetical protein
MHQAFSQNMKNAEFLEKKLQKYQYDLKKSAHDPVHFHDPESHHLCSLKQIKFSKQLRKSRNNSTASEGMTKR